MKKLINDPHTVVDEAIEGFILASGGAVERVDDTPAVRAAGSPVAGRVGIVSGGGSGHEPLHAGFVGEGMLTAAVPGAVFTSPTPDPVQAALRAVDGGAGVLLVVKNYTGDVLNFETAAELAELDGQDVRTVLVADDVAVEDSTFTAGRRGVAGTVVVEKLAGAAAARGDDLGAVAAVAEHAADRTRSIGVALAPCTVPHVGEPSFTLGEDEIEFGVGIHGEPGRERQRIAPADEIADRLLDAILADRPLAAGARVLVLLNGLGATPLSELYILFRRVHARLGDAGVTVARSLVGDYVTALDMAGASLTVTELDDGMIELWDAPVSTAALRWGA